MTAVADGWSLATCANRVRAEYEDMPGLCLTKPQMQRLWGLDQAACEALIEALMAARVLRRTCDGSYVGYRSAY